MPDDLAEALALYRATPEEDELFARPRALTIAGGGPAVGVGLGVLQALESFPRLKFKVWSLSCVGAWLGCLYHASPDADRLGHVTRLMESFFREDSVYDGFPCPTIFVPDIPEMISAYLRFMVDPRSYANLVVPTAIVKAYQDLHDYYLKPSAWNYGDFCRLVFNAMLAPNPAARFLTSMIYKSEIPGLNKLWFGEDDGFLRALDMSLLARPEVPILYHNAYNLDRHRLQLFSNKHEGYPPITTKSLCACSGLPYVLSPVTIDGETYVEGAMIDTVGFCHLLENHGDLREIWVCRLLDAHQIHRHRNLLEALNNLVMLFASTTAEDDVVLFKHQLQAWNSARPGSPVELIEFQVESGTNFDWTLSNLRNSARRSRDAAVTRIAEYLGRREASPVGHPDCEFRTFPDGAMTRKR